MFKKQPLLPMDTATEKNMNYLAKIGDDLLEKVAAKVDLYVGRYLDPGRDIDKKYLKNRHPGPPGPTNDQELQRFAVLLVDERKLRLDNQKKKKKKKKKKDQAQEATKASTSSTPPLTSTGSGSGSGSGSAATTEVKININVSNCSTLTDDSK
jgi:hypothetical protein